MLGRVARRERLFARLDRGRKNRALWITGPPGAGKTALVASWLRARRLPCIWYRVDAGDADPAWFFHYLGAAAARRGQRPLPHLTPEYRGGEAAFARRFFRELLGGRGPPSVLVFDDLQEVPARAALHAVLREGIEELPPRVTAILISREDPPARYAKLFAGGAAAKIAGQDLLLTRPEALAVGRAHAPRGKRAEILRAAAQAEGWTAGLVLLVSGADGVQEQVPGPGPVFDYLAGEVFDRAHPAVRRILLAAAVPPVVPVRLANRLCGLPRAGETLDELVRRALFTYRREIEEPAFELHPLFREFLRVRGRSELGPAALRGIRKRAAGILAEAGHAEAALDLFAEAGASADLARTLLPLAPGLEATGRIATLERWLGAISAKEIQSQPWLWYWRGRCRLPVDPCEARAHLARAYAGFETEGDSKGLVLAWISIVNSFVLDLSSFHGLDEWIDRYPMVRERHLASVEPPVAQGAALAMFAALIWRRLDSPELPALEDRAMAAVRDGSLPGTVRLFVGGYLVVECAFRGEMVRSQAVVDVLAPLAREPGQDPVAATGWLSAETVHHWFTGAPSTAVLAAQAGLELGRRIGVHLWDFVLHAGCAYASLATDDLGRARAFLAAAERSLDPKRAMNVASVEELRGLILLRAGRIDEAVEDFRSLVATAAETGMPFEVLLGEMLLALAMGAKRDAAAARPHLDEARRLGAAMRSSLAALVCDLCEADLALGAGDRAAAREHVARAFATIREKGIAPDRWLLRGQLRDLCALALEEGIEPGVARGLVLRLGLVPEGRALGLEHWPWPVRVRVLGRMEAAVGGEPVRFPRKTQRRPLDVLATLAGAGAGELRAEVLTSVLWPDSEGDLAHHALETALYRLRRLLGDGVVRVRDGVLSLETSRCWVDSLAFDALLGRAGACLQRRDAEGAREALDRAVRLYRGPFLADRQEAWAIAARARLRGKLRRAVADLARSGEGAGPAEALRAQALAADPELDEPDGPLRS